MEIAVSSESNRTQQAWSRFVMRGSLGVVLLLASAILLNDSTTYALFPSDPTSGRIKGCYTLVDFAVGATMPTRWARPLELLLGVLCLAMIVALLRKRMGSGASSNQRAVEQ
jgi:NADH:ubiquinone oxidoreductase subunit 6 (subunit J)